ncbi:MAG: TIGR01777 family oxidoreductase [Taibaiella sp.]|jgi:hypothetical protein
MPTVLITGSTGTIGKRLNELLIQKGYDVIILTRHISKAQTNGSKTGYARWEIDKGEIDNEAVKKSDYIINLAGAGVADKRWTDDRKREILESRTKTCALLVKALKEIPNHVKAVISASASGYYGADNLLSLNDGFTEDDRPSKDFLGDVCRQWEESIEPVIELGKRLVILRTGIVLSKKGGVYTEFEKPLNFGVATILGNGKQIVSWIHEDDICNMYIHAIETESMSGPYNAVAPHPISNKELVLAIAKARHRFYIPVHVPTFALRLRLGEMSIEVLKSANLSPAKIQNEGYTFLYPEIKDAVNDLAKT